MRDRRSAFMLVNTRDGAKPATMLTVEDRSTAQPRPRVRGKCLIGSCQGRAARDGLCIHHDAEFRLVCLKCGKKLNDAAVDAGHGHCLTCWRAMKGYERNGYISSGNGRKA